MKPLSLKFLLENEEDRISGGLADKKNPSDFDQDALMKGTHVEFEHTNDIMTAMEIAMDHLVEDPEYYEKLDKVHSEDSETPSHELVKKRLFVGPQKDGMEEFELDKDDKDRLSHSDLSLKQVWQRIKR